MQLYFIFHFKSAAYEVKETSFFGALSPKSTGNFITKKLSNKFLSTKSREILKSKRILKNIFFLIITLNFSFCEQHTTNI